MSVALRPTQAWSKQQKQFRSSQNYFRASRKFSYVTKVEDLHRSAIHQQDDERGFSIPGLSKIFDINQALSVRIFWVIVMILCTAVCLYQLSDRTYAYFQHRTNLDVVVRRNQTIRFPSMTICPSLEEDLAEFFNIFTKLLCKNIEPCNEVFNITQNYYFSELNATIAEVEDEAFYVKEEQVKITVPGEEFGGMTNSMLFRANYTHVRTFWGNCLVITPQHSIEYRGPYTFITVEIMSTGAMFFLHNQGIKQRHDAYFLAEQLNGLRFSNIRLGIKQYNFLNTGLNPCMSETEVVKCRNDCIDQKLDKILNCSIPLLIYSKLPSCISTHELFKAYDVIQKFYTGMKSDECSCHRKCDETLFSVTTDVVSQLSVNETHFKLYYPDNLHEIVNESYSYSFSALLSDIGGTLGFYLGFCVVTLVEIFDYVLRQALKCIHHWLK